jgi:hypothetical protein
MFDLNELDFQPIFMWLLRGIGNINDSLMSVFYIVIHRQGLLFSFRSKAEPVIDVGLHPSVKRVRDGLTLLNISPSRRGHIPPVSRPDYLADILAFGTRS